MENLGEALYKSVTDINYGLAKWIEPYIYHILAVYVSLPILAYFLLPFIFSDGSHYGTKSVTIFVLGDIGHSPRMCNHAKSFANLEYNVNLCGYNESTIPDELMDSERIDIYAIKVFKRRRFPYIVYVILKATFQCFEIFKLLSSFRGTDYIMIQNPPSLPVLAISVFFIKVFSRKTKLIIDWHNMNYSILNMKYNDETHVLVRFLKGYEKIFSRFADINLTVTEKMKSFLIEKFEIDKSKVLVFYDRPGDNFAPLDKIEFTKDEILSHEAFNGTDASNRKIVITSTSFTPDEDFNILLDGLKAYEQDSTTEPVLVLVTGKGPLKTQFLRRVKQLAFSDKIKIKSVWLSYEDYPIIMAVADIGISLHTSSSGMDLPMKILDFYGCGVPAISLNYPAISELVHEGVNGYITDTNDATELSRLLKKTFQNKGGYEKIKENAIKESQQRWKQNWNDKLGEIFNYR
ncbi:chitobiosyldiphosphodolichol beta-mannosyltransferase [[Candida] jaroonii]|uniref:Chitobiosyldiphosphodolichol beta-mannosyltransferase n=1 Tax=[Candida] jaroonii TaxID=467808 RepID=A0ACA9Y1T5_9ASCO|nr:chitobiosyldiphosphodolichol beta-mannosyltransferase [[Candida] jaroonii]